VRIANKLLTQNALMSFVTKESLRKLKNSFIRHSGVGQNQVKTIVHWMLAASDSMSSAIAPALLYYCTSLYKSHDIPYIL